MRFTHVKRWTLAVIWARTPRIAIATFLICFLSVVIGAPCWPDEAANKAARELAQRLAAQIDHQKKLYVEAVDVTGEMRPADLADVKKVIESELRARGLSVSAGLPAEVKIQVTLSRNNVERLLIADYDHDGAHEVAITPFEQSSLDLKPWLARAHLDRELIFSGNSPILDFGCTNGSASKDCGQVLLLYSDALVLMAADQNFPRMPISRENAWARDLRGRLKITGSNFEARIEGVECTGNVVRVQDSKCASVTGPWIFAGPEEMTFAFLAPSRNWFQGLATAGSNTSRVNKNPFFSLAGLDIHGDPGWISSETNGGARLFNGKNGNVLGIVSEWGSELATVKSDCSTGWQILTTSKRDHTELDFVTVFEWTGNEFRALSDPLEMNGTIVAMWSDENSGPARAVVHNLKTGNYEAYLLKVGCSQ
jgi:hypothetical protein